MKKSERISGLVDQRDPESLPVGRARSSQNTCAGRATRGAVFSAQRANRVGVQFDYCPRPASATRALHVGDHIR